MNDDNVTSFTGPYQLYNYVLYWNGQLVWNPALGL